MEPSFIVAIDFGTTFTGLAWSSYPYDQDEGIQLWRWTKLNGGKEIKTPTAVLFDEREQFLAFGFEAVDQYIELDDHEKNNYYFFLHFKMELHKERRFDKYTKLKTFNARGSKKKLLIDVISASLEHLKNVIMEEINNDREKKMDESHVRWVVTVPSIWEAPAKQLMREAAYQAGLPKSSGSLVIALEPECAALHILETKVHKLECVKNKKSPIFIVLDCGGGTVDIVVEKLLNDEKGYYTLEEEYMATGGPWGGKFVNDDILKFIRSSLCEPFCDKMETEFPTDWFEIMNAIEGLKQRVNPTSDNSPSICISNNIYSEYYKWSKTNNFEQHIASLNNSNISYKRGRIFFSAPLVRNFILSQAKQIIDHLRYLIKIQEINVLYHVGGFAECKVLQDTVKTFCENELITYVRPPNPTKAIVDGAVRYGLNPKIITQRVSLFTYGMKHCERLALHENAPEGHFYKNQEGIRYHKDLFTKAIGKGEKITKLNHTFTTRFIPTEKDQRSMTITFYKSTNKIVHHVTDFGTEEIGVIHVDLDDPSKGYDRTVEVTLDFLGTEIAVMAKDLHKQKMVSTSLDFLSSTKSMES